MVAAISFVSGGRRYITSSTCKPRLADRMIGLRPNRPRIGRSWSLLALGSQQTSRLAATLVIRRQHRSPSTLTTLGEASGFRRTDPSPPQCQRRAVWNRLSSSLSLGIYRNAVVRFLGKRFTRRPMPVPHRRLQTSMSRTRISAKPSITPQLDGQTWTGAHRSDTLLTGLTRTDLALLCASSLSLSLKSSLAKIDASTNVVTQRPSAVDQCSNPGLSRSEDGAGAVLW